MRRSIKCRNPCNFRPKPCNRPRSRNDATQHFTFRPLTVPMKLRLKILLLAAVPCWRRWPPSRSPSTCRGSSWRRWKAGGGNRLARQQGKRAAPLRQPGLQRGRAAAGGRRRPATRQRALNLLAQMEFGRDGYFFVYDLQGRNLMHRASPNWWARNSGTCATQGQPVIQNLLAAAGAAASTAKPCTICGNGRPPARTRKSSAMWWCWSAGAGCWAPASTWTTSTRPCSASTRRRRPTSATCSPGSPASPPSASWAWPPAGWR